MASDHELLPITDRECYCFFEGEVSPTARSLFETFTSGSLMTAPPIECNEDGRTTYTIIGTEAAVQAAVDGVPDAVAVTVGAVGGKRVAPDSIVGRPPPRKRDAAETALELGYYDVPRDATSEDVDDELGCATATAAEHLQKAESAVIVSLSDGWVLGLCRGGAFLLHGVEIRSPARRSDRNRKAHANTNRRRYADKRLEGIAITVEKQA
uniref:helix-turn-helix domain-containing protein n=1 Tax=Natrinema ejinorense TaxID=373386 RepID=UPI001FECD970|nr:helix-turn-helix domain-containing protein [Natrinema ejinorense]